MSAPRDTADDGIEALERQAIQADGIDVFDGPPVNVNPDGYDGEGVGQRAPAGLRDEVARAAAARDAGPDPIVAALLLGAHLAESLPPLEYLVPMIGLTAGSGPPHLVAGYGFTGKTMALQSMLLSLAAGRPVWGGYSGSESRVVHVDLEQGRRLTQRRYQRIAHTMGVDLAELGDKLAVSALPRLSLTDECRGKWLALMHGRNVMLVDSLKAATGGQDENSSEMRAGLDMLGKLSGETGCRAIVIHHARKPQADSPAGGQYAIRGSGAIFDALDGAYIFSALKGEPVSVEHVKAREHGELVEGFALVISDVEADGDPRAGLRVQVHGAELVREHRATKADAARDAQARRDAADVRKTLAARPGLTRTEVVDACRLGNKGRYQNAMAVLGGEVEVREVRAGRNLSKLHYLTGTERGND